MAEMMFADAVRDALAEEMRRDKTVWCLGEDLTTASGSTSASQYDGLVEEFGEKRVVNTPISENTIMGAAVGAAVAGTRPVADLRSCDFGMCAADELVNQAAKIRYMFGGQATVPLVFRASDGAIRQTGAQHSQCLEAVFAHFPGLHVVAPATVADAKGLLAAAIAERNPVMYLGRKSDGRLPFVSQCDLHVRHVIRSGKPTTVILSLNVVNLLNQDAVNNYYPSELFAGQNVAVGEAQ